MMFTLLHHAGNIKRVDKGLNPRPRVQPARSHALRHAVGIEVLSLVTGQILARMQQVNPESENYHGGRIERVKQPLVVLEVSAGCAARDTGGIEGVERLDSAVDAAHEHEGGRSVEGVEEEAEVAWEHAGAGALAVEGRDDEDDAELDDALEDDGDGHEGCAAAVEAWFFGACCEACPAGGSEGLDEGANVDEEVDGAVGVEPGEHRDVVHDAAEDVVGGGREDRGSGVDEDSGRDVDVYIVWVVAGDGTQDPADGVNERAPEHPERHPPEAVAAVNVSKAR